MEKLTLKANLRKITGRKVKNLRKSGEIPAVLYGKNFKNLNLSLNQNVFKKVFVNSGTSTLVNLEIEGSSSTNILIHEPQINAVSGEILHVDLYKVDMSQKIHTEIPLKFVGTSAAVQDLEGSLITSKDAVEIEALPSDLVSEIEVDISNLKTFEDLIKVNDLSIPEGIEVLDELDEIIAQVTAPRSEEELENMEKEASAESEKAQIEDIESKLEQEKATKEETDEAAESEKTEEKSPQENKTDQKK